MTRLALSALAGDIVCCVCMPASLQPLAWLKHLSTGEPTLNNVMGGGCLFAGLATAGLHAPVTRDSPEQQQ